VSVMAAVSPAEAQADTERRFGIGISVCFITGRCLLIGLLWAGARQLLVPAGDTGSAEVVGMPGCHAVADYVHWAACSPASAAATVATSAYSLLSS
jgi:hypothetical protein